MAYINFPIKLLKKIEPLLEEYFSYERSMFHLEFEEIHNIYIQNGKYSKEQEETYLAVPSFKQSYIETSLNTEKMYETMMQVGKAVMLDFGDYDFNKILQMYFDFVDEESVTETDWNIAYSLVMVAAIYHKYVNSDGFFDFRDFLVNDLQSVYNTFVRPDLLKLYEMFHDKKQIKSNTIRIEYNNEVITLDNCDNWFMNMITPYLDKYLGVSSLEEAQKELEEDYPTKGRKGRKKNSIVADWILWQTSQLLQLSSFAEANVQINKSQAAFLLDYMKYLRLIEEDSQKDDLLNLRATLNNLKKNNPKFSWWNIPKQKESPNNPFNADIHRAW